ncbi:FimV/HubP family polar landmark protein [Roseateles cavernae]|uniref:FimV/HubP family polar landmark protein n=1 Tax=Roseateles cavernae TaxID=3153578 RepID=UPI0032E42C58
MKQKRSALGRFALTPLAHMAMAAFAVAGSGSAWSLGLGKLTVQSSLGETLKAEIDVSSLTAEEAGTLKVRIAPPDSYRATGVEYNAVLTGTQVQLERRSDGRPVLRINSDRAVQEPFVDVILELTWSSGRLVREYTLLFDPPNLARPSAPPAVTTAPSFATAPAETRAVPTQRPPASAPLAAAPAPRPRVEAAPAEPARAPRPAPAPAPSPSAASEYKVKAGDSLSRIAGRTKPREISLDQMLVGLFRSNPDAFIGENMNRLKSGVVLQVPGSDSLSAITPTEAREVIQAQSADFSNYRQRLAGAAPELKLDESQRQVKGKVQAAVEDRKPAAAPSPDKLTLSKAAAASAAAEAKVSKETEKKADAARVAELTRNVEELKKLSSAAKPAASAAPAANTGTTAASAPPALALPAPPVASAPAPVVAAAPAASPVAAKPAPTPVPPPAAEAEGPGLMAELMESPLVLPIAGVLVLLLGGLGLMRLRGKGGKPKADTGFHESRLQPDSFFGNTGGQRVDTRDANGPASSMSYSLSQLDAIGDVDPVAEADVYLAYGRDLQAEEILKEALRSNPERLAIRLKLLEVYAKRRDTKGFEQLAVQLYAETQGQGEDWAKAQELGRQIDADNPLYQPGGSPELLPDDGSHERHPEPMNASTLPQTAQHSMLGGAALMATEPLGRASDAGPPSGLDLDLDLDLGSPPSVSPFAMDATQALATTVEQAPLAMDFDLDGPPTTQPGEIEPQELAFDLGNLDMPPEVTQAATLQSELPDEPQSLDFDLSSIDLDLPEPARKEEAIPTASAEAIDGGLPAEFESILQDDAPSDPLSQAFDALDDDGGDPLQRQLELADEFRQIGDTEGARDVLQELLARASGPLRDKAQAMLNELR